MCDPVFPYRVEDGAGREVAEAHEGPGEKREPDVQGGEPEYVVEGKESEQLQLAFEVALYRGAAPDDPGAAAYLSGDRLRPEGAALDVRRGPRRHDYDLRAECPPWNG